MPAMLPCLANHGTASGGWSTCLEQSAAVCQLESLPAQPYPAVHSDPCLLGTAGPRFPLVFAAVH